ncbi:MAG: ABC transporter permease [Lachnospiraceae bacterium]|nr:ABC transporter permease [Lachnospiraceae bacterium]
MNKLVCLTKRNCAVFLKDKAAVFYSLLSMIIVLVLMGVFLGDMNVSAVTNILNQYGGVRDEVMDSANAKVLISYWTLSGLMVVNALTVTLTVLGTMVTDKTGNKLKSFYTAPVSKFVVALSYIASAVIIGFLFCTLTLAGYILYIYMNGGAVLSAGALLKVMGYTLVNVTIFSIVMYLFALIVNSSSAWSGIATIVGTLVGFFGAIYVPIGSLPEQVAAALKCFPILHGTSLMRKVMCEQAMADTFTNVPAQVLDVYREEMGIDILMNESLISDELQLSFMVICGMIALVVIAVTTKKKQM